MTPAAHWSPDDYYRASRAARAAWAKTSQQLEIGLEETVGEGWGQPTVSSSPPPQSATHSHRRVASPSGDGLDTRGAEPRHGSDRQTGVHQSPAVAPSGDSDGSAPPQTQQSLAAPAPEALRGQGR